MTWNDGATLVVLWVCLIVVPCPSLGRRVHFVNVLYRHGERSPVSTYPNSLYQEDFWPQGFGELSRHGIQMQYNLGQYLRNRYSTLLSTTYSRYEIHVRSSDLNRTLMSAESNLAGLYPPTAEQIWNPNILWQPIPVHTKPQEDDYLLGLAPCPKYELLLANIALFDPEYLKLKDDYSDFLRNVSYAAGFDDTIPAIVVIPLEDPLFVERLNNLTLPDWATDDVMDTLQYLVDQDFYFWHKTKDMSKLRAGNLVGAMINNMLSSLNTTVPENKRRKMYMYSAHDTTVAALLSALGVYDKKQPPLASCVGLDFIQEEVGSNNYTVEIWYRKDPQVEPLKLTLPGCEYSCPIEKFIELTKDIVPKDIVKECAVNPAPPCLSIITVVAIALAASLITTVIVSVICICIHRRHVYNGYHQKLPTKDFMP